MLRYLILETDKATRDSFRKIISEIEKYDKFEYAEELLAKMELVDTLSDELTNNLQKTKKIKI
jgi:hypothetical protein